MDFWQPEFDIDERPDGTIYMRHKGDAPKHHPTLADYIDKWADAAPYQNWLARRDNGGDWKFITYGAARNAAKAIGSSLLDMGLGPDRPLLILSENSLEHGQIALACLYVGIPFAPVSPAYSLISKDHAKLKGVAETLRPGAIFADDGAQFAEAYASIKGDELPFINVKNAASEAIDYATLFEGDPITAEAARSKLGADTVAKYLFTSGSTGSPKAVINTNGMICAMQALVRDCYRFMQKEPPIVLDWAPWNHTAAGNKVSYMVLTNGGTYYIDDGRPVPGKFEETLRNLRDVACTWYFNVPVGWDRLADVLEEDKELAKHFFSRLKMMFYAGAGMAQHTSEKLSKVARATTGKDVLLATSLGSTETAPFATAWTELSGPAGNLGVPGRGLTMKLVPNGGKLELRFKGPSITPGYYGDPEKTAEAFDEEGFYMMGDALRPVDSNDFTKGFLFDGRTAENFKLSTGTWVTVGSVRAGLVDTLDGLIKDAVIVGENEAQLGAILILSERTQAMSDEERNRVLEGALVGAAKKATGSSNRIRRATIMDRDPSFDAGEITEKGSLNQRALRANLTELIAKMYADTNDDILKA